MITIAIFFESSKYATLQVFVFLSLSFIMLIFVVTNRPYVGNKRLFIELINEAMVSMLSYFAIVQLMDQLNIEIGLCINLTIYLHVSFNIIIITYSTM